MLNQQGEEVELDLSEAFKGPGTGLELSWAEADLKTFPRYAV